MSECLFCEIIKGNKSSYTIYEDEVVKVFLDVFPDSTGHTLIIPKKHYLDLSDIPLDVLNHVMSIAKKIKLLLESKLNSNSIILIQNNGEAQNIKHYHLHLVPKYKKEFKMGVEEVYNLLKETKV